MVRKDPLNERGPKPPGGRPLKAGGKDAQVPGSLFVLYPEQEYHKLWRHVLIGTGTCVRMLEGYANLSMPGDPLEALVDLRDRLSKIINKYEAQNAQ